EADVRGGQDHRRAGALGREALGGVILMMRVPMVRMMRQPPTQVPAAIALAALTTTHVGTSSSLGLRLPLATSARKITPIVFWASLVPCESEKRLPDTICPSRKPRATSPGGWRPTIR